MFFMNNRNIVLKIGIKVKLLIFILWLSLLNMKVDCFESKGMCGFVISIDKFIWK